ncbi:M35 family metallo-endopeptidase [Paraburkholderia susongensis]|uniref:Lysine-specific metallo-endopeptidase n=1 Tax=Paraburkholderia susongensis TaxID=1515439 RepID=A0A1X7KBX2_9BURK|nr:M35 family metallo-endopeptidase [Paraburkholderia susongensis]SMG38650.1 Lysine-specific metallo-endopeptidase [Paraburkholderia susongensis]
MNDFDGNNKYGFKANENEEWFEVHASAVTNTNPGSMVHVTINTDKICPNMSNRDFRDMVLKCRDRAIGYVETRLKDLARWSAADQERVRTWFGYCDESARSRLTSGLTSIVRVLRGLTGDNFVRWEPDTARYLGCVPNPVKSGVVAEVCAPDTKTHTIAIHVDFCSMRDFSWDKDSMISTLIHEASHFQDTMGTKDWKYFMDKCLSWGPTNPDRAIDNADSIAGYVIYNA